MSINDVPTNRLLAALPRSEYKLISSRLERVPLVFSENIYQAGQPIHHVYFPESGIISLLSGVADHCTIEVGIVGDEGMVGLPVFLGVRNASSYAVVQGEGFALRLPAGDLAKLSNDGSKFQRLMLRFMHSVFTQVSQAAACNQFHRIDERLARWLLMTSDRMHSNTFRITQEFLSNMLGVRREGVNRAAGLLQQRELVSYANGSLKVRNRRGLERAACKCYKIIKREYEGN